MKPARAFLPAVAAGLVGAAVLAVLLWTITGGQLHTMETPSMCPAVCVGSLVADRPAGGQVHVGEIITFHPPGNSSETYTHEVVQVLANGLIETKGFANQSRDPWLLTPSDVVGRVAFTLWGVGWLLKGLPVLAVGVACWVISRRFVRVRFRRAWDRVWLTFVIIVPEMILHPLVRGVVTTTTGDAGHAQWATASVVDTGILPTTFTADRGGVLAGLGPSLAGHVSGPASPAGAIFMRETPALAWWGWAIAAAIALLPLLGYAWHIWRDNELSPDGVQEVGRQAARLETVQHEEAPHLEAAREAPRELAVPEPAATRVAVGAPA